MRAKVFDHRMGGRQSYALPASERWARYRFWLLLCVLAASLLGASRPAAAQTAPTEEACAGICVSALPAEERDRLRAELTAQGSFGKLERVLTEQGYSARARAAVALRIDLNPERAAERGLAATYYSLILPYASETAKGGLISAWGDGQRWEVVATRDRKTLYMVRDTRARAVTMEEYRQAQPLPLDEIALPEGVVLPGSLKRTVTTTTTAQGHDIGASYAAPSGCKTIYGKSYAYSATGLQVVYRWNMTKSWCYRYNSVVSASSKAWPDMIASTMSYHGELEPTEFYTPLPRNPAKNLSHYSYRWGKFENVIPIWGTINHTYPWIWIKGFNNGGYGASAGF